MGRVADRVSQVIYQWSFTFIVSSYTHHDPSVGSRVKGYLDTFSSRSKYFNIFYFVFSIMVSRHSMTPVFRRSGTPCIFRYTEPTAIKLKGVDHSLNHVLP